MTKKIILIDFEGIQSFGEKIPYMFSLSIRQDSENYLIRNRQIKPQEMVEDLWQNALLKLLEDELLKKQNLKNWEEFNQKCELFGWDTHYENSIFLKLFNGEQIVKATDLSTKGFLFSLSKFEQNNLEEKPFFPGFKTILMTKKHKAILALPGFLKKEINSSACKKDGRLASIGGYVFREMALKHPIWDTFQKYLGHKKLNNELKQYSISDIQKVAIAFEGQNTIKDITINKKINLNKLKPLRKELTILKKINTLLKIIEDKNLNNKEDTIQAVLFNNMKSPEQIDKNIIHLNNNFLSLLLKMGNIDHYYNFFRISKIEQLQNAIMNVNKKIALIQQENEKLDKLFLKKISKIKINFKS